VLALADIQWNAGELDGAIRTAREAYEALVVDDADRAAAAALLGKLLAFRTDGDGTLAATEHALRIAEPLQRWETIADALITRGAMLVWTARFEEGRALLIRGTDIAHEHDLPALSLRGHNNLSWMEQLTDRLPAALAYAERALVLARARGDRVWSRVVASSIASLHAEMGDWDEVEAELPAVLEARDPASITMSGESFSSFAAVLAGRGQAAELSTLAGIAATQLDSEDAQVRESCVIAYSIGRAEAGAREEAIELLLPVVRVSVTPHRQLAVLVLLESAWALGREDLVRETVAFVRGLPPAEAHPTLRSHADRFAGLIAAQAGDVAEAERLLESAAATLAGVGRPFERAKALLDLGELLGADGRELLVAAHETFAELRATPLAERAERALAGAAA
jgi:tetratricopeptide (TPR) repeat protein